MIANEDDLSNHTKRSPSFERKVTYLDNLMVVVCDFKNGPMKNPDPPHSHPHEQITFVAEGELIFFKEKNEYHLVKGDLISVPSGVSHCIQTITSHVTLVDSFHPIRQEFIEK